MISGFSEFAEVFMTPQKLTKIEEIRQAYVDESN